MSSTTVAVAWLPFLSDMLEMVWLLVLMIAFWDLLSDVGLEKIRVGG